MFLMLLLESDHLQKALIFCFYLKKSAAESHQMLVEAYGKPKKFENAELQVILDELILLIKAMLNVAQQTTSDRLKAMNEISDTNYNMCLLRYYWYVFNKIFP